MTHCNTGTKSTRILDALSMPSLNRQLQRAKDPDFTLDPLFTLNRLLQVAHVVEDVVFLKKNDKEVVPGGWAEQQIATSADFCHNSFFWTHFSGGLNYQVIHHLFPGIIHTHYPAIAPIVMRIAKKHGVKYQVYETFWSALVSHFSHLRRVGAGLYIPSLQTVG